MFDNITTAKERTRGFLPANELQDRCLAQAPDWMRSGGGYEETSLAIGDQYFSLQFNYDPSDSEDTGFFLGEGSLVPEALAHTGTCLEHQIPLTPQTFAARVCVTLGLCPQMVAREAVDLPSFWAAEGFQEPAYVAKSLLMQYRAIPESAVAEFEELVEALRSAEAS